MSIRAKALALCAVTVLVAGCGGSSNNSGSNHPAKKKTASAATKPKTTASSNTAPAAKTSTGSSSGTPTFASAGDCLQMAGVGEQFSKAMASAMSGGKYNLATAVKDYQALANASPSAIRSDMETIASAFSKFASELANSGWKEGTVPSASQVASLEAAGKAFDASGIKTAATNIESWAAHNCKA